MNRFLIIGASGFIGGHLWRIIKRQPNTALLGTHTRPPSDNRLCFDLSRDDIQDYLPSAWREPGHEKWALLCAAVVPMDRCASEPGYARSVMLDGSRRCLDTLVEMGFTPVFISTSYVFDGVTGGYREEDSPTPICNYGRLKYELELYLRRTHPQALVARLGKIVGTDPRETHLFSDWHQLAARGQPIVCVRDQQLSPTLVDDVAGILYQACLRGLRGVYHVANSEPIERAELAHQFSRICGLEAEVRSVPLESLALPEPRPLRSWLVADKIRRELDVDFTPVAEILEQFREAIRLA